MCGIIGKVGNIPSQRVIEAARDQLTHRGPDDAGLWCHADSGIALGHRRLSIIDTSKAGHQPMVSANGRYIVVFNGEIYNYLEIRKELEPSYQFQTKTDTEVLLASYQLRGEACLQAFNGMFAFAIWDKQEQKLFCARDRMGVKPFFYHVNNQQFSFASEIKALLALGIKATLNENAVFNYLYHGLYDHSDETFFAGIKSLPPGHYVLWQDGQIKIIKYWDVANVKLRHNPDEQEIRTEFVHLLEDSIRLRFRSDVPVGVNLSSGMDSNSIYHYALRVTGEQLHTFSKCLSSSEYNECELLETVLSDEQKHFWHTVDIRPEAVLAGLAQITRSQDQPFGGVLTIAYDIMMAAAQQAGITVLLEGQGGDELLAGYSHYRTEMAHGISSVNAPQAVHREALNQLFIANHSTSPVHFPQPFGSALLNAQYRDLRYTKLPRVLRFNDHVTMSHGRELRLPFLDYRMVEFCFTLSDEYKIKGKRHKVLLRDAMAGVVPRRLQELQKKNAGAIQTEWFRTTAYREYVYALLESASFRSRPFWDHARLREQVDAFYHGIGDNSFFIWQCVNLELWLREYIDN